MAKNTKKHASTMTQELLSIKGRALDVRAFQMALDLLSSFAQLTKATVIIAAELFALFIMKGMEVVGTARKTYQNLVAQNVLSIDEVDTFKQLAKLARALGEQWLNDMGKVIGNAPENVTKEDFDYMVEVKRLNILLDLQAASKECRQMNEKDMKKHVWLVAGQICKGLIDPWQKRLYAMILNDSYNYVHYMSGIGFLIKSEGWCTVGNKIRGLQVGLRLCGIDANEVVEDIGIFDCGTRKKAIVKNTIIGFDKKSMEFHDRVARLYNQPGSPWFRGRTDRPSDYDGRSGTEGSLFMHGKDKRGRKRKSKDFMVYDQDDGQTATDRDENIAAEKAGVFNRHGTVWALDYHYNRIEKLLFDSLENVQGFEDVQGADIKCSRKRKKAGWMQLYAPQFVREPIWFAERVKRAASCPELFPLKNLMFGNCNPEETVVRVNNILDYAMMDLCMNRGVVAISKKMSHRAGELRFVVVWPESWEQPQVLMVYHHSDWKWALNEIYTDKGHAPLVGIQVYGDVYADVLRLMGFNVKREGKYVVLDKECCNEPEVAKYARVWQAGDGWKVSRKVKAIAKPIQQVKPAYQINGEIPV